MIEREAVAVVLAAGQGKRMRTGRPKVLHEVAGQAMLSHVLDAVSEFGIRRAIIVVGPDMDGVEEIARRSVDDARIVEQTERRGTGHAVIIARPEVGDGPAFILFGDTPLIRAETIQLMADCLVDADLVVLGFRPGDPTGYGRLITDDTGALVAIREHGDANEAEQRIALCFSGLMAFRRGGDLALLDALDDNNVQGELYLTDVVAIARDRGLSVVITEAPAIDVMGVNGRSELARAEAAMQERLRARALDAGATLIAPETVHFAYDTALARDVVVEPNVVFGPGVSVGEGAHIRAFSHIEGAHIAERAHIGPYARLRPGAEIGPDARVGNFVELKNAKVGPGAKINHLTYIGDATIGERANIGAGTITCNYDGVAKYHTEIGPDAFIGSNTALVAPVKIGEGAYIATGSVITGDVEADALAIARVRQVVKPGRASRLLRLRAAAKQTG